MMVRAQKYKLRF